MLDVREPTFVGFWNNTDYWWNGSWNFHSTTFPNQGAKDFWACVGGKLVFRYTGVDGFPAMADPITSSNRPGMVRLGFIFPPPDAGNPQQSKIIRGVPTAFSGGPQILQRSIATQGSFRQANKEQIDADTLAEPHSSCSVELPVFPEYWCFDVVQRRRNQIMGDPMQPLYLTPQGTGTIPVDVDSVPLPPFTGIVPLASGEILFNTNTSPVFTDCP
jgi:hypothetical protein